MWTNLNNKHINFATKNLLVCLCSVSSTVETGSMIFPYLVNFYLQIQNPIHLVSMSAAYLESFGADLSENKLFQCVSILLTGTSTVTSYLSTCLESSVTPYYLEIFCTCNMVWFKKSKGCLLTSMPIFSEVSEVCQ